MKRLPDVSIHVANFLGLGEEFESNPSGTSLTLTRVRLGSWQLEIHQDPGIVLGNRQDYRGGFVQTTRIVVKAVGPNQLKTALRVVQDVCWLLSVASMSRVVPYQLDCPPGKMVRAWSVVGTVGRSWNVIDIRDGGRIRQFLEQTFPLFRRLRSRQRIIACIDTLLHAEVGAVPVELRMVIVYVCLEMLKDTWARGKGIPYLSGAFRRRGAKGKAVPYKFEELLRDMCAEVGMKPSLRRLVRYRNALIHSGGMRLANSVKRRAYENAQQLAREYILRRLGYRGPYVVFGAMRMKTLR